MGKKQPKSWSDKLNKVEVEVNETMRKLAEQTEAELSAPPPQGLPIVGLAKALEPTEDQIKVMCLQRELHLARAEILELKLRDLGIEF